MNILAFGEESMDKATMVTAMPLEKMPFEGFYMPQVMRAVFDF